MSSATGADSMPPTRDPRNITPLARPRSQIGNHIEKLRAMFGNAPASPAPNRKRIATSDGNPRAADVSIVKADHHNTMRVRTRRGPMTSPSHPEGISNSEYDKRERAEDDAHLEHAEVQVIDDERRRGGDADAIQVGDDGQEKREAEHAHTNTRNGHQGRSIAT